MSIMTIIATILSFITFKFVRDSQIEFFKSRTKAKHNLYSDRAVASDNDAVKGK